MFGLAYAEQYERDHKALVDAIGSGRVTAISDIVWQGSTSQKP